MTCRDCIDHIFNVWFYCFLLIAAAYGLAFKWWGFSAWQIVVIGTFGSLAFLCGGLLVMDVMGSIIRQAAWDRENDFSTGEDNDDLRKSQMS